MKKFGVVFVLSLLAFSFFVSAQGSIASGLFSGSGNFGDAVASIIESIVDGVKPIVQLLVGTTGDSVSDSSFLFAKFLLLILVVSVIWIPVKTLPFVGEARNGLAFVIALIVGLLSIRFLSSNIISTILLPYTAIGISITAILPLILYFVWVEKGLEGPMFKTLRKAAWIFALVVFISLYFVRLPLLNPPAYAVVYLIAGLLCFLFFLFDKTIQKAFVKAKYDGLMGVREMEARGELIEKLAKLEKRWLDGNMTSSEYNRLRTHYGKSASFLGVPLPPAAP
ncbi:MAG: hypothetical protein ACP5NS_03890 [Candidatus Pacearchaeota archaeon]